MVNIVYFDMKKMSIDSSNNPQVERKKTEESENKQELYYSSFQNASSNLKNKIACDHSRFNATSLK